METLVKTYEAMAAASGNEWHIQNAREHRWALEEGVYDIEATESAIRSLAALLVEGARLEA